MLFAFIANAQVGIGTISPNSSAQLDVTSTTKGLLIPRMLDTERSGILTPATGLLVYQTNGNAGFWYYTGTQWIPLRSEGGSAIIPFASGGAVVMTTIAGGLVGTVSTLGFGVSQTGISLLGGAIDLGSITSENNAFVVPRNGTITSMSGFFSNTVALALVGSSVTVTATLYKASAGSNSFTATGASVTLAPAITGVVSIGATANGTNASLNVPVTAGERLLMVYSATASGITLVNTVTGFASAGVSITE